MPISIEFLKKNSIDFDHFRSCRINFETIRRVCKCSLSKNDPILVEIDRFRLKLFSNSICDPIFRTPIMLATAPQLSGATSQQQRRVQKAKPVKRVIAVNLPEDLQTIESVTSTFYPYGEILLARVLRNAFHTHA